MKQISLTTRLVCKQMDKEISKEKIKREINKWDPIGLLSMEYTTKDDEYDPEVNDIYERIQKYDKVDKAIIAGIVYVVFARAFDTFASSINKDDCFEVAEEILKGV